ncbi:MAG: Omp28 family outer membrane lipoprotein [Prevotella sp.]|uniref:Omp28 family outer membrane lipoprotein n=1 Tax=Prevotella sp. TaxID=59823 RepID=UPI002A304103|nr:Omp28 family outer membrane lipoprotein [Prevotella sp.]MDD7318770.1 Omp28 family outer membrane lipoprotein [Prevotellaceae bacterium]MDY4019546.1 Omp28 family outer membrane lipoprotein [Prevotella sp.]
MKRLIYIIIGVATTLASCSNIDENERLLATDKVEIGKKVLIEDFTGQNCINCPEAVDEIENIQKEYGKDNVIAVGIHSGQLSYKGSDKHVGLFTETGQQYYDHWKIESQPTGIINRQSGKLLYTAWAKAVRDAISQLAPMSIAIENTYDEATRTVSIDVKTAGVEDAVAGKLQVWAIENNIVAMQKMPDGSRKMDYVHNHVFRAAVNGVWGDDFAIGKGETKTKHYTLTLGEKWVAENVSIVAFVYNDSGVQQVECKPIK